MKDTLTPAIKREIAMQAKLLVQATALRLDMQKREAAAKETLTALMKEHKLAAHDVTVKIANVDIDISLEMKSSVTTVIDIDKLTKMLTPAQFKQCASVTLKAAKEVLPQALIDQCSSPESSEPTLKVKAGKNLPTPEVKLS